ncbi:MAG: WecB/TagA/CpsF family glycosyltransferase [Actinomycetes bacterium]
MTNQHADTAQAAQAAQAEPTDPLLRRPELSVVVPFYNPGHAVRSTVTELVESLRAADVSFEVLAVDDGSTDDSALSLSELAPEVRVIRHGVNHGKGAALRRGFKNSRGTYIAMIDADGDIDPKHIVDYLRIAQAGKYPVVVASRANPASVSGATPIRKLMSASFNSLVSIMFDVDAHDTQVGCKVFQSTVIAQVLPRLRENRFAFDLEFFVLAKMMRIGPVYEAPVVLRNRLAGSTVGPAATMQTIRDAFTVFGRLHLTSGYGLDRVTRAGMFRKTAITVPQPHGSRADHLRSPQRPNLGPMPMIGQLRPPPTVPVLGVEIGDEDPFDMVDRALADFGANQARRTVLAMHITALNSIDRPGLREAFSDADYLHADGVSVAIIAKLAGAHALAAVPTTDLGPRFLEVFDSRWGRAPRVAMIGGEPGISQGALTALVDTYGVEPVFSAHGFHHDWQPVLAALRETNPDIVFIGLGMPLEAYWVQQWRMLLPDALVITCGGWPRLLSGDEVRAPAWLLRLHLEFAWRWATDFDRTNERYLRGIATVARGSVEAVTRRWRERAGRRNRPETGPDWVGAGRVGSRGVAGVGR